MTFKHTQKGIISYTAHQYLDNFTYDKYYRYSDFDFNLLLELEEGGYIAIESNLFGNFFYLIR